MGPTTPRQGVLGYFPTHPHQFELRYCPSVGCVNFSYRRVLPSSFTSNPTATIKRGTVPSLRQVLEDYMLPLGPHPHRPLAFLSCAVNDVPAVFRRVRVWSSGKGLSGSLRERSSPASPLRLAPHTSLSPPPFADTPLVDRTEHSMSISLSRGPSGFFARGPHGTFHLGPSGKGG